MSNSHSSHLLSNPRVKLTTPHRAPSKTLHLKTSHTPYQRVFGSDLAGEVSCAVALKMPSLSSRLKSPLLPSCSSSPFCLHHVFNSQTGLLPEHCDLTWCDGSSQPGRGPGGCLTHPTPRLVPDSGSLLEGHTDLWDTQWRHSR